MEQSPQSFTGVVWNELRWVAQVMKSRLDSYRDPLIPGTPFEDMPPPALIFEDGPYGEFVARYELSPEQRLVVGLCLTPELIPSMLVDVFNQFESNPDLGFVRGQLETEMVPTVRTALHLLGGLNVEEHFNYHTIFNPDSILVRRGIIDVGPRKENSAHWLRTLRLSGEAFHFIITGEELKPEYNNDFPAIRINTHAEWEDLVLDGSTMNQVKEMMMWLQHSKTLLEEWGMYRKLKPGYRSLFYGPPGTGKTMTASLLGKLTGRDVYRIDLSQIVSKYIGETEKNLARIFDQAEHKSWILFFDEADSLFGKRGKVNDARDRYANQEVSFLLQRIEDFDGLVILASNLKSNMDDAFLRRFQSVVAFPFPKPAQRKKLWQKLIPSKAKLGSGINLTEISKKYELSGGSIVNVMQYAALKAIAAGDGIIRAGDLEEGIRREYHKEGKVG